MNKGKYKYERYNYTNTMTKQSLNLSKYYVIKNAEIVGDELHITYYAPTKEVVVTINMKNLISEKHE